MDWRITGEADRGRNKRSLLQVISLRFVLIVVLNRLLGLVKSRASRYCHSGSRTLAWPPLLTFRTRRVPKKRREAVIEIRGYEIRTNYKACARTPRGDPRPDKDPSSSKRHRSPGKSAEVEKSTQHDERYMFQCVHHNNYAYTGHCQSDADATIFTK